MDLVNRENLNPVSSFFLVFPVNQLVEYGMIASTGPPSPKSMALMLAVGVPSSCCRGCELCLFSWLLVATTWRCIPRDVVRFTLVNSGGSSPQLGLSTMVAS